MTESERLEKRRRIIAKKMLKHLIAMQEKCVNQMGLCSYLNENGQRCPVGAVLPIGKARVAQQMSIDDYHGSMNVKCMISDHAEIFGGNLALGEDAWHFALERVQGIHDATFTWYGPYRNEALARAWYWLAPWLDSEFEVTVPEKEHLLNA
jgi:hypothetical protein